MPKYKYTAVNVKKEKFTGTFIAENEQDLTEQLAKQNLFLVSCSVYSDKTPSSFWTLGTGKVSYEELAGFCRQFATMLGAGISIIDSLENIINQPFSSFFKKIMERVYEDVRTGKMLAEAVDSHKKVFPNFFRSMLYIGEESGRLEQVLLSLADYYDRDCKLKKQVKSALAYPIMLGVLLIGIVLLMMLFVIPTFRSAMDKMNVKITGITAVVYDLSDFMLANWRIILLVIFAVVGLLLLFGLTKKGKYFYSMLKVKMPFIGPVTIDLITARFARGFALLISSGMDAVEALKVINVVLDNVYVEKKFAIAVENVCQGMSLTEAFKQQKIFPDMLIQMINVGEKTAGLEEVLNKSFSYFDDKAERALTSLAAKIQPIMIIIMGVVVGVMFIAVYSPMLDIMNNIGNISSPDIPNY